MIQQITAVALRILSIWLLIQLILNLPGFVMLYAGLEQYQQQTIPDAAYTGTLAGLLLVGILAAILINKAANTVLKAPTQKPECLLNSDSQKFLFQLVGLYFVVNSLANFPRSLSFIPNTIEISASDMFWSSGLLFQLMVGLWLISYSAFWIKVLRKLRGHC